MAAMRIQSYYYLGSEKELKATIDAIETELQIRETDLLTLKSVRTYGDNLEHHVGPRAVAVEPERGRRRVIVKIGEGVRKDLRPDGATAVVISNGRLDSVTFCKLGGNFDSGEEEPGPFLKIAVLR
jgi:hypothetical protein